MSERSNRKAMREAFTLRIFVALSIVLTASYLVAANDAVNQQAFSAYKAAESTVNRSERIEAFRRAELLFAKSVEEAEVLSPDLLVNLGNAAIQADHLGTAVLAYHRALRLDPDHQRASQNLQYARSLLPDWVPRPESDPLVSSFFGWATRLTRSELQSFAGMAFVVAALLVAIGIRFRRTVVRNFAVVPAVVWVALLCLSFVSTASAKLAVVTVDEVTAKSSDSANAPNRLAQALPGGTEIQLIETRDDWTHVRLADGRDAWLPTSSIAVVDPNA